MKVGMQNPRTGEVREIKIGWSWVLFLFSGFLGLPLFLRKLHIWGAMFLALWIVDVLVSAISTDRDEAGVIHVMMFFVFLGLEIWLGIKGNEMTAKNYLDQGWVFLNPDGELTKMAKARWRIPL